VTEGIVLLRGKMMHQVVKRYAPEGRPLYPSERTFPGNFTYPGWNLMWLHPDEMPDTLPARVRKEKWYPPTFQKLLDYPYWKRFRLPKHFYCKTQFWGHWSKGAYATRLSRQHQSGFEIMLGFEACPVASSKTQP
jgi:hypothetical protein